MHRGYVKLHRCICDNELWCLEPFTYGQAWVDLICLANHKDGSVNIRGNIIPVKRGQVARSEQTLASRWQWSRGKVRRYIDSLRKRQMIVQQKSRIINLITIINYDRYQTNDTTDGTTERQQTDNRRYTYNNDKNVKNENNTNVRKRVSDYPERTQKFWKLFPAPARNRSSLKETHRALSATLKIIEPKELYEKIKPWLEYWGQGENGQYAPAVHRFLNKRKWETPPEGECTDAFERLRKKYKDAE